MMSALNVSSLKEETHAHSFARTGKSITLSLATVHRDKCQTCWVSIMASTLNQPPSVATCGRPTYMHMYVCT